MFIAKNMDLCTIEPLIDNKLCDVEEIRRLYDLFDVSFNLMFVTYII